MLMVYYYNHASIGADTTLPCVPTLPSISPFNGMLTSMPMFCTSTTAPHFVALPCAAAPPPPPLPPMNNFFENIHEVPLSFPSGLYTPPFYTTGPLISDLQHRVAHPCFKEPPHLMQQQHSAHQSISPCSNPGRTTSPSTKSPDVHFPLSDVSKTFESNGEYAERLAVWLKRQRMHKYYERLLKYSFEQLLQLDRETLLSENFTQGAVTKLLGMLKALRQDHNLLWCCSIDNASVSSRSPVISPNHMNPNHLQHSMYNHSSPSNSLESSSASCCEFQEPSPMFQRLAYAPPTVFSTHLPPLPSPTSSCLCSMCCALPMAGWLPSTAYRLPSHAPQLPPIPQPQFCNYYGCDPLEPKFVVDYDHTTESDLRSEE